MTRRLERAEAVYRDAVASLVFVASAKAHEIGEHCPCRRVRDSNPDFVDAVVATMSAPTQARHARHRDIEHELAELRKAQVRLDHVRAIDHLLIPVAVR